jgi:hypothetical protein
MGARVTGAFMTKIFLTGIFATFAGAAFCLALPAAAEPANLLGVFGNWAAYTAGSGASQTCYALSKPRATRPANIKRGATYLLISDWPARKVKAEPQIVYGYQGKESGAAALAVGGDKFPFFIRNNGKEASSWLQQLGDNDRLIGALHDGVSAVATGTSARGAKTSDTYSLAGFNDALAKMHAACSM